MQASVKSYDVPPHKILTSCMEVNSTSTSNRVENTDVDMLGLNQADVDLLGLDQVLSSISTTTDVPASILSQDSTSPPTGNEPDNSLINLDPFYTAHNRETNTTLHVEASHMHEDTHVSSTDFLSELVQPLLQPSVDHTFHGQDKKPFESHDWPSPSASRVSGPTSSGHHIVTSNVNYVESKSG